MAQILIIDDEAPVRTFLRHTLEQVGHRVSEASDGRQGLEMLAGSRPDLVITDLFMPDTDGFAVIDFIRQENLVTKVITITAGLGDDCAEAKEKGATRTLVKPLSVASCWRRWRRCCSAAGGGQGLFRGQTDGQHSDHR